MAAFKHFRYMLVSGVDLSDVAVDSGVLSPWHRVDRTRSGPGPSPPGPWSVSGRTETNGFRRKNMWTVQQLCLALASQDFSGLSSPEAQMTTLPHKPRRPAYGPGELTCQLFRLHSHHSSSLYLSPPPRHQPATDFSVIPSPTSRASPTPLNLTEPHGIHNQHSLVGNSGLQPAVPYIRS